MGIIENRVTAFHKLGVFISVFVTKKNIITEQVELDNLFCDGLKHQIKLTEESNQWFTKSSILFTLKVWLKLLNKDSLNNFIKSYNFNTKKSKKVAIVTSEKTPLACFHDFLCVLLSGNFVVVKQDSKDKHLLPFITKYLEYVEPELKGKVEFTEHKIEYFDAVIATVSQNKAHNFKRYFKNKPNIIRVVRNSVAILTGKEVEEDFINLSDDIFRYFGLSSRSVSKLFVPKNYNFDNFFKGMYNKKDIMNNKKYINNYNYNKSVYLMSNFNLLENGFLMIKESKSYFSPIATVFYEYYNNEKDLIAKLYQDREKLQCIVAKNFTENEVVFGESHHLKLKYFSSGVNTLEFLSNI